MQSYITIETPGHSSVPPAGLCKGPMTSISDLESQSSHRDLCQFICNPMMSDPATMRTLRYEEGTAFLPLPHHAPFQGGSSLLK